MAGPSVFHFDEDERSGAGGSASLRDDVEGRAAGGEAGVATALAVLEPRVSGSIQRPGQQFRYEAGSQYAIAGDEAE